VEISNISVLEAGLSLPASTYGCDGRAWYYAQSWCSFAGNQDKNNLGIGLLQSPCMTGAGILKPLILVEKRRA